MKPEDLSEGDRILFNDRKQPLKVTEVEEEKVLVEGPGGGEYEIYEDEGTLLWSKKGNRRYSSYCKSLRKVGEWIREEDEWKHSKTGATIKLEKNEIGYWTIRSEKIELDVELPKYGYNDKEEAVDEVEKFVRKNPEGN